MKKLVFLAAIAAASISLAESGDFPERRYAKNPDHRLKMIAPVAEGVLRARPTFCSVGVCFGAAAEIPGLRLEYRQAGGEWRAAPASAVNYFAESKDYRGSILYLSEDTDYEVRVCRGEAALATAAFRTWKSDVPVAKTVTVDPATAKLPLVIDAKGTEGGWIRYTVAKGAKLVNAGTDPIFVVKGAEYVLLDDMTLEGGPARCVIQVTDAKYVRIRNCDISKWGRVGRHNFDKKGQYCEILPDGKFGKAINFDGAINIGQGAVGAVVERCYVHDPNGHSVSWYYCHPAGPEAVILSKPEHSTVIRYNDFVGSDVHRWNDAVESAGNFHEDGGFNRDADIYGNYMFCANDDCIELDGGQQNVRSFLNRYECALCGLSIQGCMVSPVYLSHDLFVNVVDENDTHGQNIKMSGFDLFNVGPVAYLANLTAKGPGKAPGTAKLRYPDRFRMTDCVWQQPLADRERFAQPYRRGLAFELDTGRIGGVKVTQGAVLPRTVKVIARATGAATPFEVKVNTATDWFSVTPSRGVIRPGEPVELSVAFDAAKMNDRRRYRGAFLVRAPNGMSRVCSIDAETDFDFPAKPDPQATYVELDNLKITKKETEIAFEVPEKGRYMLAVHGWHEENRAMVFAAVDGDEPEPYKQYSYPYANWSLVTPGREQSCRHRYYTLEPGPHKLRIRLTRGGLTIDRLAITRAPELFKPR